MLKISLELQIGDKIVTNKKFTIGKGLTGKIIEKIGCNPNEDPSYYKVIFEQSNPSFTTLEGILPAKLGYVLSEEDIDYKKVERYQSKDKNREEFVRNLIRNFYNLDLPKFSHQIKDLKQSLNHYKQDLEYCAQRSSESTSQIEIVTKEIEAKKEEFSKISVIPPIKDYERDFIKIINHPEVEKIEITSSKDNPDYKWFVITTKPLFYNNDPLLKDFLLGTYKIFISLDYDDPRIFNLTRQWGKGSYFHMCVKDGGRVCFGSKFSSIVNKYRYNRELLPLIFEIIDFLKNPNENSPFINRYLFYCAQPVTLNPKDQFEMFSSSYWQRNEKWDSEKFLEDRRQLLESVPQSQREDIGGRLTRDNDEEFHDALDLLIAPEIPTASTESDD